MVPYLPADKLGVTTGEQDRLHYPGLQHGEIKLQTSDFKNLCGIVAAGETPSLTGEFIGETHGVLECTQAHPLGNQHQKGPIYLWEGGK